MAVAAGVIVGVSALATSLLNNAAKKKAAKKQREFATQQTEKANIYNSPKAQMQRFQNANLNPHLIYGQGAAGAGTYATQSEAGQGGQFQPLDLTGVGGAIGQTYDLRFRKAGMDKLEEETRKIHTETNILTQKWIVDKINYAKNQNNQAAVNLYTKKLKEVETAAALGKDAYHRSQFGDKIVEDGTDISSGINQEKIKHEQVKAAIEQIRESTSNIKARNFRIKKLNDFITNLPEGVNFTQAMQIFLLSILNK